jgi:5-methylcytosine-specific restriction endonuclease McrA
MALKPYRATSHWKKIRIQVLRRDAYTCAYCGDTANEVDHRIAKVKGGEDTLDNLVAACRRCNIQKKDQDEAVFLAQRSTPPVFSKPSLSKTVQIVPESPFNKPDTINFDEE